MSELRSSRRRPSVAQESTGGIVDLGGMTTPPLFPLLSYATESDLRSTANDYMPPHRVATSKNIQPGAEQHSCDSASTDEVSPDHLSEHAPQSPKYLTWTPINHGSAHPRKLPLDLDAFSLRNGYTLTNAELRMNEIFEDEQEVVDKKDGLVYHQGHKCQDFDGSGSSYSFVWLDDDPSSLPEQVQQWKDKQTKTQRELEGPTQQNDVRRMLETGSALIVDRTGSEPSAESVYECLLSECRYTRDCFPPRHFYITLRPGREISRLPQPFCFCLTCFERLWSGEFNKDPGPAGVKVSQCSDSYGEMDITTSRTNSRSSNTPPRCNTSFAYTNELTLDGAMDAAGEPNSLRASSLCSSRHAPPEMSSSPLRQAEEETEDMANDSPRSIDTQGDWIDKPTRFQHIAAFIKPGKTLNKVETAAVNLWKAASFEQLQWVAHRQKTEYRREFQAGDTLIDKSLDMEKFQIQDVDSETIDEAAAEAIVKLPKSRFRGCSLADVWMVMRKECAQEGFA